MTLLPRKVVQHAPTDSAIAKELQKMGENDRDTVTKLHEIAFYIASQGLPFTAFEKQVELNTLHGVKYTGSYENDTACRNFISGIGNYLFDENVKKKFELVNFISILCDGSTDKGVIEQEVLFVVFTDPETHLPTMTFF